MSLSGPAVRLTVIVGESDRAGHHSLSTEIVHRAHAAGLAGATVLRGIEGYGASNHIHTARMLSLSEDLPIVIVIVDSRDRVDAFLPQIDGLLTSGLVMVEEVSVVRYVGNRSRSDTGRREPR